jgi:hypothetical protein
MHDRTMVYGLVDQFDLYARMSMYNPDEYRILVNS